MPHASGQSRDYRIEEIKDFKLPPRHHPLSGGAEQLRAPYPTEFTAPAPGPRCKCSCASIAHMRACRLARLAQGVRRPASGMGRVPPSSHGAPCALSARRVLPVPAGRAPMPPAPHRLPAGWPVPRSKSQPAGRLEGLLRRGGRRHASARSAPVPVRKREPDRGGRNAGRTAATARQSGKSCAPGVRKPARSIKASQAQQPKQLACFKLSKNSAKHGRRDAMAERRLLMEVLRPSATSGQHALPAVFPHKSTLLQRGFLQTSRRWPAPSCGRSESSGTSRFTSPALQMFLKQLQTRHARPSPDMGPVLRQPAAATAASPEAGSRRLPNGRWLS